MGLAPPAFCLNDRPVGVPKSRPGPRLARAKKLLITLKEHAAWQVRDKDRDGSAEYPDFFGPAAGGARCLLTIIQDGDVGYAFVLSLNEHDAEEASVRQNSLASGGRRARSGSLGTVAWLNTR